MVSLQATPPRAGLGTPIENLSACHRRIEERLATLERVIPFLLDRTEEAVAAIESAFRFLDTNGVVHTADEEESLFPRLSGKLTREEQERVALLHQEHERIEALLSRTRFVATQFARTPGDGLARQYAELATSLCALYRQHIRHEDSLFPALAAAVLTPEDLEEIGSEMKRRRAAVA